jgi:FixJ family two-component response regulator
MDKGLLVAVVDDDESVRESLPDLLGQHGFEALAFASAEDFLSSRHRDRFRCLILDVAMPGMNGLELQAELNRRSQGVPIVFITAQFDETLRSRVLERGAAECLLKPFTEAALLRALDTALRAA